MQSGLIQLNIGIVDYELHRYAEAESSLRQAETNFRQSQAHTWFATVQNELGLLYRDQGRWDEALIAFQACIDQRRSEGASVRVGVALNNRVYRQLHARLVDGRWRWLHRRVGSPDHLCRDVARGCAAAATSLFASGGEVIPRSV